MTVKTYATLAEALVAFQANLPKIHRTETADTGKFKYDYASLDKITPVIFESLSAVGIAYVAAPSMEDGVFGLRAELIHTSGEKIGGLYPLGNPNAPAQAIGSAITYARRYALLALTGVQPDDLDDDGAAASEAASTAAASAAPKPESAQDIRDAMGKLVNDFATSKVNGDDANEIMGRIAPDKQPGQWTLTHLKKGYQELAKLSEDRKKG